VVAPPGRTQAQSRRDAFGNAHVLSDLFEGGVEQTYADMLRFFVLAVYVAELLRIGCKNRLVAFVRSRLHWRVAVGIAKEDYPVSIDHTYYITVGQPEEYHPLIGFFAFYNGWHCAISLVRRAAAQTNNAGMFTVWYAVQERDGR
jgi:hypothetical protein